jgi:hypothetical protein
MKGEIFTSASPADRQPLDVVRERYPKAVESVVAAFGVSHIYYKEEWGVDEIATLYYTNSPDPSSFIGVKTKLVFN